MIRSIMSIDDDKVHHKLTEVFIKRAGLPITHYAFENGLHAYDYLLDSNNHAFLPDVILLNLDTPSSGWSFLEMLIAITPRLRKKIDVIILCSSAEEKEREKAFSYNCVKGFFSMPFNQFLLSDIMNSVFLENNRTSNLNTHSRSENTQIF